MYLRDHYQRLSPFMQLMWLLFIILCCTLTAMVLVAVLTQVAGMAPVAPDILYHPRTVRWLKVVQVIQSVFVLILPVVLLAALTGGGRRICPGGYVRPSGRLLLWIIPLMLLLIPTINLLVYWNGQLQLPAWMAPVEAWMRMKEDAAQQITKAFVEVRSWGALGVNIIVIAALAAVGEEGLFRGVLQPLFIRWTRNPVLGIIVTALIFSAVHMQFYGFVPRFLLGALFGVLAYRSGSLWPAIWAHFLNNGVAVITAYFIFNHQWAPEIETFGSTCQQAPFTVASCALALLVFCQIRRITWQETAAS